MRYLILLLLVGCAPVPRGERASVVKVQRLFGNDGFDWHAIVTDSVGRTCTVYDSDRRITPGAVVSCVWSR